MTNNTQFKTLVNEWLNHKKPMITPSTHASFTLIAENHLIPYFGKRKIGSITETDIQERIRQIEVKCLQKLSKPRNMQYIRYGIQGVVQRHSEVARKQGYDEGYNDGYRQALDDTKNGIEKEGISVNILSLPIEGLCLPNRTCACLTDAGFRELRDLLNLGKNELKKIKGLSVDRRCEVAGALSKYGLQPEGWHDYLILWDVRQKRKVEEQQNDD